MPKYDYRCSAGHQYEKREGFDAPAVQTCQICGKEARRVLTPPAIVFKGSGWYITDSRKTSEASSPASSNGSSSSDSSSNSAAASTESKSDTSSSAKSSAPAAAD